MYVCSLTPRGLAREPAWECVCVASLPRDGPGNQPGNSPRGLAWEPAWECMCIVSLPEDWPGNWPGNVCVLPHSQGIGLGTGLGMYVCCLTPRGLAWDPAWECMCVYSCFQRRDELGSLTEFIQLCCFVRHKSQTGDHFKMLRGRWLFGE